MSAAFINTLFTQTVAFAADEFGISQSGQGIGASVVRLGIVICLPLVALADRYGRRPVIIAMAWAAPLVSALGAIAPSYVFLVGTQAIGRPLGLTLDILIAVVALEEMPRNTRAYANKRIRATYAGSSRSPASWSSRCTSVIRGREGEG